MSTYFSLDSYEKGAIAPLAELGDIDVPPLRTVGFEKSYEILNWLYRNVSSMKGVGGGRECVFYPVTQKEVNQLLRDCKKVLEKREEVDELIDLEVGENTVCGRSDLSGKSAFYAVMRIMQYLPEDLRLEPVTQWNVPYLRDFFWYYWEDIESTIKKLEDFLIDMNWKKEELFLFIA